VEGKPTLSFALSSSIRGGQAVLAVGYDDRRRIASDTGALLFRNSGVSLWGEHGYGWLPYSYVATQAAVTSGRPAAGLGSLRSFEQAPCSSHAIVFPMSSQFPQGFPSVLDCLFIFVGGNAAP